ncbi:hypothetical protein KIH39_02335 [Telmatocola sphagniphila]|uniref:Uncharacterized protein n=1 Tax=Telmatocola sphagniphila TaxID=1123043 RepID=A0A8E6ETS1_9BACT|nr:hypothetical protein [Telmatocola sphagniphila]QVL32779.1 hypothetical protein KIH39_02335 [Telmatocola sphagniphila]
MFRVIGTLFLCALGISAAPTEPSTAKDSSKIRLGINISSIAYYTPEIVFKDIMKQGSGFLSQKKGKGWAQGGDLPVDDNGNIKKLEPEQFGEVLLFPDMEGKYPGGEYICKYEGEGEVVLGGSATPLPGKGKDIRVKVDPPRGHISIKVMRTNPKNPVRNIKLFPAKYTSKDLQDPFDPAFLKHLDGYKVLRMMDWGKTNDSEVVEWKDRAKMTEFQGTNKGVALEYQIQLANTLKVEPWFCIPHLASDDYVAQFAKLVKEKLSPALKFHVEYSNETWNGQFAQAKYCQQQGLKLGLSKNAYEAQLRYSSQRSVEIFKIIEKEFGGHDRFVRIIATHAANSWGGATTLDWQKAYTQADAVAIAPYFGNRLGSPKMVKEVLAGGLDKVFEELKVDLADNKKKNEEYAQIASKRKLELMTYEGGQHLTGIEGQQDNEELTKLFIAANRDPRMKELYLIDLNNWKEIGGGVYCMFASMGRYTKWGSWGLLENSVQDVKTAPKYQAVQEFMKSLKGN